MKKIASVLLWVVVAATLYYGVANLVFAVRHPELTDAQRFLLWKDVLLWR